MNKAEEISLLMKSKKLDKIYKKDYYLMYSF